MQITDAPVRSDAIYLTYEDDRGSPILITVTTDFVAADQKTSAPVVSDLQAYVIEHASDLKAKASACGAQGLTFRVL
jgi:hypothetical protein